MTPTQRRERCEKLYWDMHQGYYSHGEVKRLFALIEAFAIEIRNEALEEAALEWGQIPTLYYTREEIRRRILSLKSEGRE